MVETTTPSPRPATPPAYAYHVPLLVFANAAPLLFPADEYEREENFATCVLPFAFNARRLNACELMPLAFRKASWCMPERRVVNVDVLRLCARGKQSLKLMLDDVVGCGEQVGSRTCKLLVKTR